jgi:hypothetical protein
MKRWAWLLGCWPGLMVAAGCGDATSVDASRTDSGGSADVAESEGPTDDAPRVDVQVPGTPRAFRLGGGVSVAALGSPWWDATLDFAEQNAEWIVLHIDVPLPWAETAARGEVPSEWVEAVGRVGDEIAARGLGVVLLLDLFANDRRGLVVDEAGLAAPPSVDDGVDIAARLAAALVARTSPTLLVATYELNLAVSQRPELLTSALALQRRVRSEALAVAPSLLVAAVWDWETLRQSLAAANETDRALLSRMDELTDVFGVRFGPSEAFRALNDLALDELSLVRSRTTRPVMVLDTWWPASGQVRRGEVFASSENTQFNYVAWLQRAADAYPLRGLAWAPVVDPGGWTSAPCATWDFGCDAGRLSEKWQARGPSGFRRSDGRARAGIGLWEATAARPLP